MLTRCYRASPDVSLASGIWGWLGTCRMTKERRDIPVTSLLWGGTARTAQRTLV
jgi:hypothetical protein